MGEEENYEEEFEDPIGEAHWPKVLFYTYLQLLTLYGFILIFTHASFITTIYSFILVTLGVIGVNAGAHRLWAHHSYEATTGLKIFLMLCQSLTGQGSIYDWVLYHRLHHNSFGTKQDPFNPRRGFIYAHFLGLLQKSTPEKEKLLKTVDMSDLEDDRIVIFQKKYYWLFCFLVFVLLPIYIPIRYWNESVFSAIFVAGWMRYGITINFAWLIHSATVIFGLKRGEKYPSDTNIVFLWYKTYWLRYHYLTPWDYQTGEYGKYGTDFITTFIRVCAALELATNLRTADGLTIQNALYMALETKKPVSQCLLEFENNGNIPKDHYLNPKKYNNSFN